MLVEEDEDALAEEEEAYAAAVVVVVVLVVVLVGTTTTSCTSDGRRGDAQVLLLLLLLTLLIMLQLLPFGLMTFPPMFGHRNVPCGLHILKPLLRGVFFFSGPAAETTLPLVPRRLPSASL